MNRTDKIILVTAVLLATITISAIYLYETDPQTIEERKPRQIQQEIEIPETATYLGKHVYNVTDQIITVYTWKKQNTLFDAQILPNGDIKTNSYILRAPYWSRL